MLHYSLHTACKANTYHLYVIITEPTGGRHMSINTFSFGLKGNIVQYFKLFYFMKNITAQVWIFGAESDITLFLYGAEACVFLL